MSTAHVQWYGLAWVASVSTVRTAGGGDARARCTSAELTRLHESSSGAHTPGPVPKNGLGGPYGVHLLALKEPLQTGHPRRAAWERQFGGVGSEQHEAGTIAPLPLRPPSHGGGTVGPGVRHVPDRTARDWPWVSLHTIEGGPRLDGG